VAVRHRVLQLQFVQRAPKFCAMLPRTLGPLRLDVNDVARPTGAPVLCLHGLFAGSWVYERFLPMLATRGYPAAALSFRGHPPAAPIRELGHTSISAYCHDAAEAARALDRPVVVGHSLGGLVALMLAARNLVRAAILVSSAPPRGITVLGPQLLLRMPRYLPALLLSRPFLPTPRDLDVLVLNRVPPAARETERARLVADSGRAARQAALGTIDVPARDVRIPMLVVGGDDDKFIPLGVARRIAQRYGAPLHVARGHGHFLLAEPGWEEQAVAMIDWIDQLPASTRGAAAGRMGAAGANPVRR
jgi:pimeloyl-ACP methyl ester carboxylesterase